MESFHPISLGVVFFTLLLCCQASTDPFSPKASLLRYWSRLFSTDRIPEHLLSKASPLTAVQLAAFSRYIDTNSLRQHSTSFCSAANLLCDLKGPANVTRDLEIEANFQSYTNKQFRNYIKGAIFGIDFFKNYSIGENVGRDSFTRYSDDSSGHTGVFNNYADNSNVGSSRFTNYDNNDSGGGNDFRSYGSNGNVQGHGFSTYGTESSGSSSTFSSYSDTSNVVRNNFKSYGIESSAQTDDFTSYSTNSNVGTNSFKTYGEQGNAANQRFTTYAEQINSGRNHFRSYSHEANSGSQDFSRYGGNGANIPQNFFKSYGEGSNNPEQTFTSYGNSSTPAKSDFIEYGKDVGGLPRSTFTTYFSNDTSFKQYFKTETRFQEYLNSTETQESKVKMEIEEGKFFRQANLVKGKKITMPDLRDKMPRRSFLPKIVADKLPFNSSQVHELTTTLAVEELEGLIRKTITECERPPAKYETKRCVTSIEGMMDFAVEILGKKATVSTTESTNGWGKVLTIGDVAARNGGKMTRSVSCHQSLFPYLVYYCHAVPRVMVYDVGLHDVTGTKVNQGVAICHMDTTQWGRTHAAFVSLGSKPGDIEVCHWIFENDMIWVARD